MSSATFIMLSVNSQAKHPLLTPPVGMPDLAPDVLAHGEKLVDGLKTLLDKNANWISFADYMKFCLYDPTLGYYSSGLQKFGGDGDFITAPEVSPLFGVCMAEAISALLKKHPDWSICELGPGRGALAEAILTHLDKINALPASYQLLEVSASLSDVQRKRLEKLNVDIELIHLDQVPENFKGIFIANEVIDALVVERFTINEHGDLLQSGVSLENDQLKEIDRPAPEYLHQAISELDINLPKNYRSEICLQLKPWLQTISESTTEAIFLFSDYGFSQSEYYSAERSQGTLRCHYRQHAHNDFTVLPGLQDLTAWVNFTQLAEAALALKVEVVSYTTQAHFLLGSGHLQQIGLDALTEKERFKISKDIQTLTLPANMGERFRFMQLNKNCNDVIPAMAFRDLRHQL